MRRTPTKAGLSDAASEGELLNQQSMLSPFKELEWLELSPAERLARAWALRKRLIDPADAHDRKLFPAP